MFSNPKRFSQILKAKADKMNDKTLYKEQMVFKSSSTYQTKDKRYIV